MFTRGHSRASIPPLFMGKSENFELPGTNQTAGISEQHRERKA